MTQAVADPHSVPLDAIDVSDAGLFEADTLWGYFDRLGVRTELVVRAVVDGIVRVVDQPPRAHR